MILGLQETLSSYLKSSLTCEDAPEEQQAALLQSLLDLAMKNVLSQVYRRSIRSDTVSS